LNDTPKTGVVAAQGLAPLGPAEAAIFETFVVPRYLTWFGELALDMLAISEDAQVAHLFCRTGYPDRAITERLRGSHVYGCDASPPAVELARAKAATTPEMVGDYRVAESLPVPLPAGAFSHAVALHPLGMPDTRAVLLTELARLLGAHGQALVAMPLRGSFQEVADLLREYALKHETESLKSIEEGFALRPSVDTIGSELEQAGFHYVEVDVRTHALEFKSGRDFFEDPITRLVLLPDLREGLALEDWDRAVAYVRDAIDKYWSDDTFALSVNVGCVSGRRLPEGDR
jgi:SAM-dependent methyltransferase